MLVNLCGVCMCVDMYMFMGIYLSMSVYEMQVLHPACVCVCVCVCDYLDEGGPRLVPCPVFGCMFMASITLTVLATGGGALGPRTAREQDAYIILITEGYSSSAL